MGILPHFTEMLILPHSEKKIRERLYQVVYPLNDDQPMAAGKEEDEFDFNGHVRKNDFRISRRIKHSDSFLPLIKGSVEETRSGSIVHLTYGLFPSTKAFLWFWLTVSAAAAIVFFLQKEYIYGTAGIAAGIFCYTVARVAFNRSLKDSRQHILAVFG